MCPDQAADSALMRLLMLGSGASAGRVAGTCKLLPHLHNPACPSPTLTCSRTHNTLSASPPPPPIPQAQGEWTPEEHELFLATARQHGVGDAWGLFASYIPRRVGYQCSAYYRDVVIPTAEVLDGRWAGERAACEPAAECDMSCCDSASAAPARLACWWPLAEQDMLC